LIGSCTDLDVDSAPAPAQNANSDRSPFRLRDHLWLAQGISAKNKQHKSNVLANHFALSSSSAKYPPRFVNVFLPIKTRLLQHELSLATPFDPRINRAFTLKERISAVRNAKNTTPGSDNICYEMFEHLSIQSLEIMLQLFNKIWFTGKIPPSWLHSIIVPIAKPNQPSHLPANIPYQQCVQTLKKWWYVDSAGFWSTTRSLLSRSPAFDSAEEQRITFSVSMTQLRSPWGTNTPWLYLLI